MNCVFLRNLITSLDETYDDPNVKYYFLKESLLSYCDFQEYVNSDRLTILTDLPLYRILHYLQASDLANLARTCRRFRDVCEDDVFWKDRTYAQLFTQLIATSFVDEDECIKTRGDSRQCYLFWDTTIKLSLIVETLMGIYPLLTWKWWYGKLRTLFYGGDNSDNYDIDIYPILASYKKFEFNSNEGELQLLLSHLDIKRKEHSYFRSIKKVNEKYARILNYDFAYLPVNADDPMSPYILFNVEDKDAYLIFVAKAYTKIDQTECDEVNDAIGDDGKIVFNGILIGPGFVCTGRRIIISSTLRNTYSLGTSTISWFYDGFTMDVHSENTASPFSICHLADIASIPEHSHPKIAKSETCINLLNDKYLYPQWITSMGYCRTCYAAGCDPISVTIDWKFEVPNKGFVCRCSKQDCKVTDPAHSET